MNVRKFIEGQRNGWRETDPKVAAACFLVRFYGWAELRRWVPEEPDTPEGFDELFDRDEPVMLV